MLQKIMATESSISSVPVNSVTGLVVSGGQKVNRSLEALCNAANSELRNIGQSEITSQEYSSPQVFAARALVPLIASNGNLSWNIVGGLAPAKTFADNSDGLLPQIFPAVAFRNPYQVSHCFVSSNSTPSNHLPMTSNFLGPQPRGLSMVSQSPQLAVRLPVAIESMPNTLNSKDHFTATPTTGVISIEGQQNAPNDGETRAGRHTCEFCERRFVKPSVLVKHLRTHTGERPYPCPTCGLSFKTKSNLYKHRKSRTHQHTLNALNSSSADTSSGTCDTEAALVLQSSTNAGHADVADNPFGKPQVSKCETTCTTGLVVADLDTPVADVTMSIRSESSSDIVEAIEDQPSMLTNHVECTAGVAVHIDLRKTAEKSSQQPIERSFIESSSSAVSVKSDVQSVTTEALQDRISRLISQNASIINTPMAEPPRVKRILRQSSDVVGFNQAAKSAISKPLLRTLSLNPSEKISTWERDDKTGQSEIAMQIEQSLAVPKPDVRVSNEVLTKLQYLAVPVDVDRETNHNKVSVETSEHLPNVNSSNVRIVLQLCEGMSNSLSAVSSEVFKSVSSQLSGSSMACEPIQPPRIPDISTPTTTLKPLSITSNALPALRLFKPSMGCSSAVSSCLPVQYVQPSPVINPVPFQYIVVSGNGSAASMTFATSGSAEKPAVVSLETSATVFPLNTLPPRRGRPKGSKNRPKLVASASDPQSRALQASTPNEEKGVFATSSNPLWKQKLKKQLLMRRLLSNKKSYLNEQSVSCEEPAESTSADESALAPLSQLPCDISLQAASCQSNENPAVLEGSTSVLTCPNSTSISAELTSPSITVTLSVSCDSSIPLKKRRKTLTELGKGTTFGTRVEDAFMNEGSVRPSVSDAESKVNFLETRSHTFPDLHRSAEGSKGQVTQVPCQILPLDFRFKNAIAASESESADLSLDLVVSCLQTSEAQVNGSDLSLKQMTCSTVKDSTVAREQPFSGHIISHSMASLSPHRPTPSSTELEIFTINACSAASPLKALDTEPAAAKTSGRLFLLGHSYPSLILGAKPTFCALRPQPFCATTSTGSKLSMYGTWHNVSTQLENGCNSSSEKTSTETFASYRTVRRGEDSSYAAARCDDDKKRSGILTHSSYWNYRKDKFGSDDAELDSIRCDTLTKSIEEPREGECMPPNRISPDVDLLNDSLASCSLVMNNKSTDISKFNAKLSRSKMPFVPSSKLRFVTRKLQPIELAGKRTWICPGGYRSIESYVYVRGRGRGSYVCATCGIRCKKPSILRKHLHLHTDLRPHHCIVCDVGFKSKGNLSKHLNSKLHHMRSSGTPSSAVIETFSSIPQAGKCESYNTDAASLAPKPYQISTVDELETDSGCELHHSSSFEVDFDSARESSMIRSEIVDDSNKSDEQKTMKNVERCSSITKSHRNSTDAGVPEPKSDNPLTSHPFVQDQSSNFLDANSSHHNLTNLHSSTSVFPGFNALVKGQAEVGLIVSDLSRFECRNVDEQVAMLNVQVCQASVIAADGLSIRPVLSNGVKQSNIESMHKASVVNVTEVDESGTEQTFNSNTAVSVLPSVVSSDGFAMLTMTNTRIKPSMTKRCEIFPVPGLVSTEGVRVGTSYACPTCRKQFSSAPRLALHRNIHFFERPVRCPICRASFASRSMVERHRLAEHGLVDPSSKEADDNPRPYKCDECGIAFRIRGHLAKHRRSKSHAARVEGLQELPSLDDVGSEMCLEVMVNIASDDTEAQVHVSDIESSAESQGLNNHLSDVHGEDTCKNDNTTQSDQLVTTEAAASCIDKTETSLHLPGGVSEHTCDICGEISADISIFKKHLTSHVERRPFICEHCDAGFTSAKLLLEHKKVHTQVCAHVCEMCGNKADDVH